MKATGIVRKMDELGRVVIPRELRRTADIKVEDLFEFFVESDGSVVIKSYQPGCIFCGELVDKPIEIHGRQVRICGECAKVVGNSLRG